MFNRTIMYAKLAWVYAKESLFIKRKFRWIDLALLPFGLCVFNLVISNIYEYIMNIYC